jgi:DNA-binding PucR family transcriptional regulator
VAAEQLLPERALAGDGHARRALVAAVYAPLAADRSALLETTEAYLATGGSVEGAARRLLVHPNTVRYRLRRVHDVTGWAATDPRGAYVLRVALTLGRLAGPLPVDGGDAVGGIPQEVPTKVRPLRSAGTGR